MSLKIINLALVYNLTLIRLSVCEECNVEAIFTVEKIPVRALFKLKDGRIFRKEEKLRKRYKCVELASRRVYLFSPVAEVELVEGN